MANMSEPARQADTPVAWQAQAGPQADAIALYTSIDELFFGGAVFGGKTDFLLGDYALGIDQGSAWTGILFRPSFPELDEVISRSHEIYPHLGGEYLVGKHTWRFETGAQLRLRHLDNPLDYVKYRGHEYAWQGWDELPSWPDLTAYHRMKAWLRGPAQHKRIRATGNPGGRCHAAIKDYFRIARFPAGYQPLYDTTTQTTRCFIPSRVADNAIGLAADPTYVSRLKGVGDPELVAAWLRGDWDAIVGSYFSMLDRPAVEVDPFEVPEGWTLFSGGDYGEHNPCWWGLLAVDFDDDIWIIDEYYKGETGGADHARNVKAMIDKCPFVSGHKPRLNLAPADMWTKRAPGEANQAMAPQDSFVRAGVHLPRANMDRVNGWRNLKDLLDAGRIKFVRGRSERVLSSLASVSRDRNNPEDVQKGGDDHPADGLRYLINHVYKPRKRVVEARSAGTALHVLDLLETMGGKKTRYA